MTRILIMVVLIALSVCKMAFAAEGTAKELGPFKLGMTDKEFADLVGSSAEIRFQGVLYHLGKISTDGRIVSFVFNVAYSYNTDTLGPAEQGAATCANNFLTTIRLANQNFGRPDTSETTGPDQQLYWAFSDKSTATVFMTSARGYCNISIGINNDPKTHEISIVSPPSAPNAAERLGNRVGH